MQEDASGWVTTSSTGDGAIPGEDPIVADAPLDAFEASVFQELKTNTIAQRIGEHFGDQLPPMKGPIPPVIFLVMVDQVKFYLPKVKDAKGMAGVVFRVWEKMHVQPPGWVATLALLLVYLLAAILTVPWLLPLFLHTPRR